MRRSFVPLLVLAPSIAAAGLLARGLAEVAATAWLPPGIAAAFAPPPEAVEAAPARTSAKTPGPLVVATKRAAVPKIPEAEIGACPLGARVVASVTDPDVPSRSLAVVAFPAAAGETKPVLREGSFIAGRTVRAITKTRVYLRDARGTCFVGPVLPREEPAPAAPAAKTIGIERVDEGHVRVDRLARDKLVESHAMATGARIVPVVEDGRVTGMKIAAVRPGSLLAELGLRAGDTIKSVNGFEIGSAEQGLEAFARLKSAPKIEIALVRAGKAAAIVIEVV